MKINNIYFCFKHQHEFIWDHKNNQNRFVLLFFKRKTDIPKDLNLRGDFAVLFNHEGLGVFPEKNEDYILSLVDFELNDVEVKRLVNTNFPFNQTIEIDDSKIFQDILQMMHRDFYVDDPKSARTLSAYLELFFSKLMDILADKKAAKQPQFEKLLSIRAEIYANPTRRIPVKDLAAKAFLSVSYFQHLYKEYFETSVVSDMILSRIEYGKNMLVSTTHHVKEIAKILNYSDEVSFARQFRKVTGVSPKAYQGQFKKQHSVRNTKKR